MCEDSIGHDHSKHSVNNNYCYYALTTPSPPLESGLGSHSELGPGWAGQGETEMEEGAEEETCSCPCRAL